MTAPRKPWEGTRTKSGEVTATAAWRRVRKQIGGDPIHHDRRIPATRTVGSADHETHTYR